MYLAATAKIGPKEAVFEAFRYLYTLGRAPLNKRSARRRGPYQHNSQNSQEADILGLSGIPTRDPSNRGAADSRLDRTATEIGSVVTVTVTQYRCQQLALITLVEQKEWKGLVQ